MIDLRIETAALKYPQMPRLIPLLLTALLSFGVTALWRRPPIDDAYITMRYADQLLAGHGLVYNMGEYVLGTTTPLWAAILALCTYLGIPTQTAAVVGGYLAMLLAVSLYFTFVSQVQELRYQLVWIVAIALYFPISIVTFCGMETGIYTLVVGAGLYCFSRGRPIWGAILGIVATVLRPDGVLVPIVGTLSLLRQNPKGAAKCIVTYLALLNPVLLGVFNTYGGLGPNSAVAKRVLYPASASTNVLYFFEALSQTPVDAILLCVGGAGVLLALKRSEFRLFAGWGILYSAGIVFSGIKPIFFWYFGPLWILLLTVGVEAAVGKIATNAHQVPALFRSTKAWGALALILVGFDSFSRVRENDQVLVRENGYREIVSSFASTVQPGARVLVGETGILGHGFRHAYIIDSSGINSPQVAGFLRQLRSDLGPYEDLNQRSNWLELVVRLTKPDWIIGVRDRMQLSIVEEQSWFKDSFERVGVFAPEHQGGVGVYRRAR